MKIITGTEYDLFLSTLDPIRICGTDEAGRGPLAGPVYAAAAVLPADFPFSCLDDSKKLSEKEREEAEVLIKRYATAWSVAFATHIEIDRINILQASMLAMKRAVQKIDPTLFSCVLADGNKAPVLDDCSIQVMPIIKGDALIPQIMAASILAKTARDRFMKSCDRKWPQYGYASHKGYPTAAHKAAVCEFGPSPIQRMTFHV
jgi:ribonuclease HII